MKSTVALASFFIISVLTVCGQATGPGSALHFNGPTNFAVVPNFGLVVPTNEITIEFWQRAASTTQQSTFSLNLDTTTNRINAHVPWSDGHVYWDFGNITNGGRLSYAPPASAAGSWQHFALVASQSGNFMAIYRNGVLEAQKTNMTPFVPGNYQLDLGVLSSGKNYFQGDLDEFRVWNYGRTSDQIQSNMNTSLVGDEPGLVAYWRFDEGTNSVFFDASGNGVNGYLTNGTQWISSAAPIVLPSATTLSASAVVSNQVTLNGSVIPAGTDTIAWFQYGITTNYESSTTPMTIAGTNIAPVNVSALVTNVTSGYSYNFCMVASNAVGMQTGSNSIFGAPLFTLTNSGIRATSASSVVAADFDGDGKMDVLIVGQTSASAPAPETQYGFATIWRNLGGGVFEDSMEFVTNGYGIRNTVVPIINTLAVADFFNSGREDALITGQVLPFQGGPTNVSQLWHNTGTNGFILVTNTGLSGLTAEVAVGDFDNDGRLDVVYYVRGTDEPFALYRNMGNGIFTLANSGLHFVGSQAEGFMFVGDFDGDGYLDIMAGPVLWHNLGNGTFTNVNEYFGFEVAPYAMLDFDNNGTLDVISYSGSLLTRNLGGLNYTNLYPVFPGSPVFNGIGDFDNDGYPDALVKDNNNLYLNNHIGGFINVGNLTPGSVLGSVVCADFNGDGSLDVLSAGLPSSSVLTQLWLNGQLTSNSPPTAPTDLTAQVMGHGGVRMSWGPATDDHTPSPGLSYNIRVGTSPGGLDVVSPEADPVTGYRRVVRFGNAQQRLFSLLTNLNSGTYYWSVQAIDTSFLGGPFATEGSFVISPFVISGSDSLSNGQFQIGFNGYGGTSYTLQASTNLSQWTPVATLIPTNDGPVQLTDPAATNFSSRYYRLSSP